MDIDHFLKLILASVLVPQNVFGIVQQSQIESIRLNDLMFSQMIRYNSQLSNVTENVESPESVFQSHRRLDFVSLDQ